MAQQIVQNSILSMLQNLPGDGLYVSLDDVYAKLKEHFTPEGNKSKFIVCNKFDKWYWKY